MSVKKAMKNLELFLEGKKHAKSEIQDLIQQWGYDGQDVMTRSAKMIARMLQIDIAWLQAIKKQLEPVQHLTKIVCNHPKEDHDIDPDGQKYCMNCNANLK